VKSAIPPIRLRTPTKRETLRHGMVESILRSGAVSYQLSAKPTAWLTRWLWLQCWLIAQG
jgi:hypothetical protein